MSLWTLDQKPTWFPNAVESDAGWINPDTGEILVAISQLSLKRRNFLDQQTPFNLLLEDGGAFLLEPNIGDEGVDFLLWETI